MTLRELKVYLSARGRASVAEMAVHFGSSPDVVRALVDKWRSRDCIRLVRHCGLCSGGSSECGGNSAATEVYEWVSRAVDPTKNGEEQGMVCSPHA